MPARLTKADGSERRVGVEIEMSGIDLETIAQAVVDIFGGRLIERSPYEYDVESTDLGWFKVELDFEYLTKFGREYLSPEMGEKGKTRQIDGREKISELELIATDALAALAKNIVPCELVSPPIPIRQLEKIDDLVAALQKKGAKGTRESIFFAFGVHLNPELPDLESATILNYFKAFLCLCDWLMDNDDVALSRKLSPFIRTFGGDYIESVLDARYRPEISQFIDDYLDANPTRNRVMDLLPLFAHLDEPKVLKVIGSQKLRKRPTLHYRLPNSDIDCAGWGIWKSWKDWWQVEALANDTGRLAEVCDGYLYNHKLLSKEIMTPWKEKVTKWLIDPT